jgi:phenylpropionate dioxygenase-like ring-hydroxylating dioxygenase large terminal subunit
MQLTVVYLLATISGSVAFLQPRSSLRKARPSLGVTTTLQPPQSLDKISDLENESELNAGEKFDWFKAWYPIVPVEILDGEKPQKFHLLNMPIVVWKDSPMTGTQEFGPKPKNGKRDSTKGEWRVFRDECPHRKVPLSEGRVENDGSLMCSYHGWRFDGTGDLIDVPQLLDSELNRVKANPKSQCNSFPVKVIDGVLWIWPETGSDARIQSALTEVNHYKVTGDVSTKDVWYGPWYYRELPYGADYFIENILDPAHVAGKWMTEAKPSRHSIV